MEQTKTKKALIMSVLSVFLCIAMLIGMTFAWFTDTASTGVNKITAGNLKMEVTYKNTKDGTFAKVDKDTPVLNNSALWEPGHVEYVVLNVKNVGNLALKYKLGINIASETGSTNVNGDAFKLSDYIKFAVVDEDQSSLGRDALVAAAGTGTALNIGYTKESKLETTSANETVTLVVWMPESVGNEANYATGADVPTINLGIDVYATQLNSENDSYGPDYDKNAAYPNVAYTKVSSSDELNNALTNPKDATGAATDKVSIDLTKGTYTLPAITDKTVTISGDKDTVVDMTNSNIIGAQNRNLDLTLEGVTVKFANENYKGVTHSKAVTYKNCKIEGKQFLYAEDVEFINCVFENKNDYCVWTYGAKDVTFTDCIFNTGGKAILIYNEYTNDSFKAKVTANKCIFNDDGTLKEDNGSDLLKAAIETGSNGGNTATSNKYTIIARNCTVNGFAINTKGTNTNSKLWANKNSLDNEHLIVTVE